VPINPVIPLKDNPSEGWEEPIAPQSDGLQAAAYYTQPASGSTDTASGTGRDGSGNLTLFDGNVGTKTLTQVMDRSGTATGNLTLGPSGTATSGTTTFPSVDLISQYSYWTGSVASTQTGYALRGVPSSAATGVGDLQFLDAGSTNRLQLKAATGQLLISSALDVISAGTLTVGASIANTIQIGKGGVTTTFKGPVNLGDGVNSDTVTLAPTSVASSGTTTWPSNTFATQYSYWTGAAGATAAGFSIQTVPASAAIQVGDLKFLDAGSTERMRLVAGSNSLLIGGSLDTISTGATLTLGAAAAGVSIGKSGGTTTITGALAVTQATTFTGLATANGGVTLGTNTTSTLTLNPVAAATAGSTTKNSNDISFQYNYWTGSVSSTQAGYSLRGVPASAATGVGDLQFLDAGSTERMRLVAGSSSLLVGAGLDTLSSVTLTLGAGTASGVSLSKTGATTTVTGALAVTQASTFTGLATANAGVTLGTNTTSTLTLSPVAAATSGATTKNSNDLSFQYNYWNGTVSTLGSGYTFRTVPSSAAAGVGDLQLLDAGSTEKVRIAASTGAMSVGGSFTAAGALDVRNGPSEAGLFGTSSTAGTISLGTSQHRFVDQNSTTLDIAVGNANQGTRLIKASIYGTSDFFVQMRPLATTGYGVIEASTSAGLQLSTDSAVDVIVSPNRTEVMRVKQSDSSIRFGVANQNTPSAFQTGSTGTLGINTISPTEGITVQGGGVRVKALGTPGQPTVTPTGGTGATSYSYYIVALDKAGNRTTPGTVRTIANGVASLSGSQFNAISWTVVPGADSYDILKTNTATKLTNFSATKASGTETFNDTGTSTSAYTVATRNETSDLLVDGDINFFDNNHGIRAQSNNRTVMYGYWGFEFRGASQAVPPVFTNSTGVSSDPAATFYANAGTAANAKTAPTIELVSKGGGIKHNYDGTSDARNYDIWYCAGNTTTYANQYPAGTFTTTPSYIDTSTWTIANTAMTAVGTNTFTISFSGGQGYLVGWQIFILSGTTQSRTIISNTDAGVCTVDSNWSATAPTTASSMILVPPSSAFWQGSSMFASAIIPSSGTTVTRGFGIKSISWATNTCTLNFASTASTRYCAQITMNGGLAGSGSPSTASTTSLAVVTFNGAGTGTAQGFTVNIWLAP
jgi:hypothetical protein